MGLGFLIHGSVRGQGLLRRKPKHAELCHRLQDAVFQAVPDPLQHRLLQFEARSEGLDVTFHPAAEPVEFRFGEGGGLTAAAKTSTVGPGYHAMLVELMGVIGPAAGIEWDWRERGEGEGEGDETGYHESGDFGALQGEMLVWLKGLADHLLQMDADAYGSLALSMPSHFGVVAEQFAHSPLGFWDRGWFEALAAAEGERAASLAAAFFPWWNHPADAAYWRECGLVLAWTRLPWTPPIDEAEQKLYELAADCFARARKLDQDIGLPLTEIEEIRELLEEEDEALPPRPEGIGFMRGRRRVWFAVGWSLELPGHFREFEDKEDEGTVLYAHGARILRVTTYSFQSKDPEANPAEKLVRESAEEHRNQGFSATHEDNGLIGSGGETLSEQGDYWNFQACIGKDSGGNGHLCVLTFSYDDPARDRDWAVQTFKSVRHYET